MKEVKNKNTGNTGILIILSIILALSGMAAMASANGYPSPPNQFYGTVDGADAGTIDAYIDDVPKGSIEFAEGKFGYDLNYLDVEGNIGDTIIFKIADNYVGQIAWTAGSEGPTTPPRPLDLSTGSTPPPSGGGDDDQQDNGNQNPGGPGGPGSSPAPLPADESATTAPGDGDGLTPESHDTTGADDPEGADDGAAPATKDKPDSTGFFTGSGATALAVVGLLVLIALIVFVIKKQT